MARIVNEKEYREKRNEILDVALRIVYTKGFEQLAIHDILDALQISKGAFYHYFSSKQELLEALVERLSDDGLNVLIPIIEDPNLTALEKLEHYFDSAVRWKDAQLDLILGLLRIWYADENAVVREKVTQKGTKDITPLFQKLIHQGIREGSMQSDYPDQIGELVVGIFVQFSETLAQQLFVYASDDPEQRSLFLKKLTEVIAVYTNTVERVLGAAPGSVHLFDASIIQDWAGFFAPETRMP